MSNDFDIINDLQRHLGQTVTIFTTSGGQSGFGFTGVLVTANENFVRLITQIGPAPGCALGNCCGPIDPGFEEHEKEEDVDCDKGKRRRRRVREELREANEDVANVALYGGDEAGVEVGQVASCFPNTLGSIVDIPVGRIVAFVHNAVGSEW